jgi:hypothetical protein
MKYFVAAEMSSDPIVIAILNHLAEIISTARRLFRCAMLFGSLCCFAHLILSFVSFARLVLLQLSCLHCAFCGLMLLDFSHGIHSIRKLSSQFHNKSPHSSLTFAMYVILVW